MMRRWSWIRLMIPLLWIVALLLAFILSPDDAFLGASVRIFYLHFGLAMSTAVAFGVGVAGSVAYLIWKRRWMDWVAFASNFSGVVFTTGVLVSGSAWAKVAWGVFWTWDPRLVTTAVMWFLYVAYFVVRGAIESPERRGRVSAVFNLVAFLDLPLVFGSIHWWRTIHPVVITDAGINISDPSMIWAMVLFIVAMLAFYADVTWLLVKQAKVREELERLKASAKAGL